MLRIIRNFTLKRAKDDYFFADFYYFFFNKSFRRQHFATLMGIEKFRSLGIANEVILRRNLHRIEKGLIMPYKKDVFAKDFIYETVACFKELSLQLRNKNNEFYQYSWDILDSYFSSSNPYDEEVKKALELFQTLTKADSQKKKIPVIRKDVEISEVTYEQFLNLSKQRRAVRFYKKISVSRTEIERAVTAALQSPSACNRQPFRLIIADEEALKNKLGCLAPGAQSYYREVPVFLAIIGDLSNYFSERDRNLIYIDGSLFAMSLMYALETLGLSSCPTNWPDIEENEMKLADLLELHSYERCIMLIGLGYAEGNSYVPYSQKKPASKVIHYL